MQQLSQLSWCTGTRSVGMMFRAVVFTFMPTAIELVLVCTLLARRFQPAVALAVLATFVAYVSWTTIMTKVRLQHCSVAPFGVAQAHDQQLVLVTLSCTDDASADRPVTCHVTMHL